LGRSHAHECHLARRGRCRDYHRKRASGPIYVHPDDWLTRLFGEDLETAAKRVLHRHTRERGTGSIARVYVYTWLLLPLRGIETGYDHVYWLLAYQAYHIAVVFEDQTDRLLVAVVLCHLLLPKTSVFADPRPRQAVKKPVKGLPSSMLPLVTQA
jgi:hypothetical protein